MADDASPRKAWWLSGNFAPVDSETEAFDLKVEGALPKELTGVYMRNGPNPARAPTGHWFMGDGMLHGVRIENGAARWYRNRYTATNLLKSGASSMDMGVLMDRTMSTANTAFIRHGGRIMALEEGHFPYEIKSDLSTVGPVDFGGKLTSSFTAHPKICAETGEMYAFGYGAMPPFLTYHRFDKAGRLIASHEIPVGGPTMVHDFNVTRRHVVFMDLPIVFDMALAMQGGMPFRWSDDYPARLGVMPRDGTPADLKWFEIEKCYVFHPMNAYDEGDKIVIDVSRYERLWDKTFIDKPATLHRWTIDLKQGVVREETLDDVACDFPRVADDEACLKHSVGYAVGVADETVDGVVLTNKVYRRDFRTGRLERYQFADGEFIGEAAPAGRDYLMAFTHDENAGQSSFVVLEAAHIDKGPIARVRLPQRVPYGFHGAWFAD